MTELGINSAAEVLNSICPQIAWRLLEGEYDPDKNYEENKFLLSAWETLGSRLFPLLTRDVIRSFDGSDFTARELMTSKTPCTIYPQWSERDLLALSPLVRLFWGSLIETLMANYGNTKDKP